jgi:hypothetical protein
MFQETSGKLQEIINYVTLNPENGMCPIFKPYGAAVQSWATAKEFADRVKQFC